MIGKKNSQLLINLFLFNKENSILIKNYWEEENQETNKQYLPKFFHKFQE